MICYGCIIANVKSKGDWSCPFCRTPVADNNEEHCKKIMKRIEANDPAAMREMGKKRYHEGDYVGAVDYWSKAAELGDLEAHCQLGFMYCYGEGVEKDEGKEVYHYEKAAAGGHPDARYLLGCYEGRNGRVERAVKHFIISANLGYDRSMKQIWKEFKSGNITKEDLEATLRTHQAAVDGMKSPQREAAEAMLKK